MAEHLNSLQFGEIRHVFGDGCILRRQRKSIKLSLLASGDWDIQPRISPTRHFVQSMNEFDQIAETLKHLRIYRTKSEQEAGGLRRSLTPNDLGLWGLK